MKLLRGIITASLLTIVLMASGMAPAPDVKGSTDHPLISRYPGAAINAYRQTEFDELRLPLGKNVNGKPAKSQQVEGKITRISYATPAGRSLLEVYRNYESGLQRAGFQILFSCVNTDGCGGGSILLYTPSGNDDWSWNSGHRYLSAKASRPEGDVYVSLHVGQWADPARGTSVILYVVETKPMEQGLIKVDAAALAGDITQTGHSAIYGIYFDTGKAELKAESDAALKEIAKLLQQDLKLALLVVGHTDNVGVLASNMDLSRRRADAVVQALATKHGIAAKRLVAQGAGPLAPVASNRAEEGRAKNRRVELVEQ